MKLTNVTVSYPHINYSIDVTHYTERKSTVIEWIILESISKAHTFPEYKNIPLKYIFEDILTFSDIDLLVKPCLISLEDMGAVILSNIDDESTLENATLGDIILTDKGMELQQKGLLPGETATESIPSILYDVKNREVLLKVRTTDTPIGIEAYEFDNIEEITFPEFDIRSFFEEIKKYSGNSFYKWLRPTTNINQILPVHSRLCWKNEIMNVELMSNMECKIKNVDDKNLVETIISDIALKYEGEIDELPDIEILEPDKELFDINEISELRNVIKRNVEQERTFIIDNVDLGKIQTADKKVKKVIIVSGAEKFKYDISNNLCVMSIPEVCLPECVNFAGEKFISGIGKFNIKYSNQTKALPLCYTKQQTKNEFNTLVESLIENYYLKQEECIFILRELGMNDLFKRYVSKILNAYTSIHDKAAAIEKINNKGTQLYKQKVIMANEIPGYILAELDGEKTYTTSESIDTIASYLSISLINQNSDLTERVLEKVIPNIIAMDDLESIWAYWISLGNEQKRLLKIIQKKELYRKYYTESVLMQLFNKLFANNLFEYEEYTHYEQNVFDLRRRIDKIKEFFIHIDDMEYYKKEIIDEYLMANADGLSPIKQAITEYFDKINSVNKKIPYFETFAKNNEKLLAINEHANMIMDSINAFYDDPMAKYSKIVVADTSALMNEESLIPWFDDGKFMLIIPQIVLRELDGLNKSQDDEIHMQANIAIRKINNYSAYKWLNLTEESHPELLSKDMDKDSNDNKILSVAIKYKNRTPLLLTCDNNLKNIAKSYKITAMEPSEFKNMKDIEVLNASSKGTLKKSDKKKSKRK